MFISCHFHVGY